MLQSVLNLDRALEEEIKGDILRAKYIIQLCYDLDLRSSTNPGKKSSDFSGNSKNK